MPVHESSDKSFVLMQAFISHAAIKSFTLILDTNNLSAEAANSTVFSWDVKKQKKKNGLLASILVAAATSLQGLVTSLATSL